MLVVGKQRRLAKAENCVSTQIMVIDREIFDDTVVFHSLLHWMVSFQLDREIEPFERNVKLYSVPGV